MIKKIRSVKGESIAETLVAVLIAAVSVVMVTTAIVVAAKINNTAKGKIETETEYSYTLVRESVDVKIAKGGSAGDPSLLPDGETKTVKVDVYKTGSGCYYYDNESKAEEGTGE